MPGGEALIAQRERAAADSDTATLQTVRRMCAYIDSGARDPEVWRAAEYAWRRFALGSADPALKCWGVFWYVKHRLKFRLDEATMFRIGLRDEQDLLIAPDALVRMREPAEDCDGFTMLVAALLTVLDVPVIIATVAADPSEPNRWSHVFPCAVLGEGDTRRVLPLDASHGPGPGWMVPAEHVYRFQAWNLNGQPVADITLAPRGLHNYVRRGLGQCPAGQVFLENVGTCVPTSAPSGGGWSDPAFWQGLIQQGVSLAGKVFTPPAYQQTVRDPLTGQLVSTTVRTATPSTAITAGAAGFSANTLWIGGGILLAGLVLLGARRRD